MSFGRLDLLDAGNRLPTHRRQWRRDAAVVPLAEFFAPVVVGEVQRLSGLLDGRDLRIADLAAKPGGVRDALQKFLPLRLRNAAEDAAQGQFRISVETLREMRGKDPLVGELAHDLVLRRLHKGQLGRRALQIRRLVGRDGERLLVAQGAGQHAHRRNLLCRVHPQQFTLERHNRDHVIELGGRRYGGIEIAAVGNERRPCLDAFGLQQRGQQRVLVFAIAVFVGQHVVGRMGLVAADAKLQRHIMNVQGNIVKMARTLSSSEVRPFVSASARA